MLEKSLRKENIKVEYENFNSMICQCVLARGDENLSKYLDASKNPTSLISALKKDRLLDRYLGRFEEKGVWKNIII